MKRNISTHITIVLILFIKTCFGQIAFTQDFEFGERKKNAAGRLPVYAPTRCKQNELLFPGDQVNDWICDCAPASIYYPETDACYPAFRQGPCEDANILVLGIEQIIPECIANPCREDGFIPIQKRCYELNKVGPCRNGHLSYVLGVDPRTLRVDCVKQSLTLETRFGELEDDLNPLLQYNLSEIDLCARGTKRAIQGHCPEN